jgi:ketosteroid isomerase-like protein
MTDLTIAGPRKCIAWRAFVSLVACSFFLLAGCGGPPKHPKWSNATGAEQYERLMWQALRDGDWKNVHYHLAPTFAGVSAEGQAFDREGWVQHWKTRQIKEFSLAEVSVQPEGPDMVVTYLLHLTTGARNGIAAGRDLRVVSVWQQVKTGWILTATSDTPVI